MELLGVLNYLHNPKQNDLNAKICSILPISNKTVIQKRVKAIIECLNSVGCVNLEDIEIMSSESSPK